MTRAAPAVMDSGEEQAIARAMAALAAQGSPLDELAEVACELLAALLGAETAAYEVKPDGHLTMVAGAGPSAKLPREIYPQPGALIACSLLRAGMVSSRLIPIEPELAATSQRFTFAVSPERSDDRRMVLVLTGDARAAVSIATSTLPARVANVLNRTMLVLQRAA